MNRHLLGVAELEQALTATRGVIAHVTPLRYDDPTPCAPWDVRALLNHTINGVHWYATSVATGASPPIEEVDFAAGTPLAAYDDGIGAALAAFGAPGALDGLVRLTYAELAGDFVAFLLAREQLVHAWDLATATGQPTDLAPALAERLLETSRTRTSAKLRGDDERTPFGPAIDPPAGTDAAGRLAAFLGRAIGD